ncbi:ParB/RepB/Spo0J family partition protein [Streptomyces lasiicapitis]|uniref:ParB-like N-terminal domain-containing protein n=1 Tax=Streptomyces lasiicapitis TaxID=1923961 RepID=A0ABQ2MY16_9ACTN|nr:ParB/RepB/Spo0J family partition protein [Streptomyces lasiicapitis]GGO60144.1 hypothetical protein GCM10012286_83360 [Streptomyces lasiicapitis]
MSKRTSFTDLIGDGAKKGADSEASGQPSAPPVTAYMHTIVGNPENPRVEADYTDADPEFRELKAAMKEIGQLQPIAVLSRAVYDQSKPGYAKQLGDADWVVVTGNRRLAAARQLGWTRIDIRVQDRLGGDEEGGQLDEAVIIENIHRKKVEPIKEAAFLQRMVQRHGSQEKVAERIGKSQMYVSHRLALLDLVPDVQKEIQTGGVKVSQVRGLSSKSADEQRAEVAKIKQDAAKPKPKRKPRAAAHQNGVLESAPQTGEPKDQQADVQNSVLNIDAGSETGSPGGSADPQAPGGGQHSEASADEAQPREPLPDLVGITAMPFGRPEAVLRILEERMSADKLDQLIKLLNNRS